MAQHLQPDDASADSHSARIRRALDAKRLRGERVGTVPIGWRLGDDGQTLVPDFDERALVARVRRMQLVERIPVRTIAKLLADEGVTTRSGAPMSRSCVNYLIQREFDED